jgi:steroid 5-alpha reductase family enzyme
MLPVFLKCFLLIVTYVSIWYLIALLKQRNDVADIAWGLGYVLVCMYLFGFHSKEPISLLLYALVTLWGLRLSIHIYARNKGKQEDFRYKQWRAEWCKTFYWRSFLQVFLLQGIILMIIISPIIFSTTIELQTFSGLTFIGVALWIVGYFFQAVGDYQLKVFSTQRKSRDEIIQTGLWKYSRHPNYFGEILMWWSIYCIVLPFDNSWWFIISPVTITYLLLFVSGVPLLEAKYKGNKAFDSYKQRTNAVFPWFPKN